jgi:hypothetical protein
VADVESDGEGDEVELDGHFGRGKHGELLPVGDVVLVGWVGCVLVGVDVGALEVVGGADVVLVGGGAGVVGAWPGSGGVPVTNAGGGNSSTGWPARSAFITADQVAVGYPAPK